MSILGVRENPPTSDAVRDRSPKVHARMYRLFVPVNIILAGLALVASVLLKTSTGFG